MKSGRPFPLLIPAIVALVLLGRACFNFYNTYHSGEFRLLGWQTEHKGAFGTAWLITALVVLIPAYLYAISLGLLALFERDKQARPSRRVIWRVTLEISVLLIVVTYCARLAVTAWFPEKLILPLDDFDGGVLSGVVATAVLAGVVTLYYRVARSF